MINVPRKLLLIIKFLYKDFPGHIIMEILAYRFTRRKLRRLGFFKIIT